MKIGVQFAVTGYTVDPVTLARSLEEARFESYWAPEHAVLPTRPSRTFPMTGGPIPDVYGQMADPFVLLSVMAGVTSTLRLGTGVCLVPEHHPLILAKSVSTLDRFSGGRFLFGLGTGWLPEVTDLFLDQPDKPWKYTLESVEAMKALWRDGRAAYDGDLVRFPELICDPRPVQTPHPPVIIGASPSPLAMRRIVRHGDGWIAMGIGPEGIAAARAELTRECELVGRDPSTIEISVGVRDATPQVQRRFEDAGADRLIVLLYNHPGHEVPIEDWPAIGAQGLTSPPPVAADTLRALEEIQSRAGL
ncbi:LLM class F420-dependent oxidoreductase [Nocardioides sp. QY071]|uniref:LLM class F420-dependent oxidoreductase n=1 Tax=Nocardioides sp. QY071 TaxID=3044187 RepID=UPI00249A9CB7|nr:LLM class F420-dependent oxidoreductase [Nocardioides sp. QY071]WGY00366.1 LLM class F420-dependent oxidoreductase [Nocardioides sp. QY071]